MHANWIQNVCAIYLQGYGPILTPNIPLLNDTDEQAESSGPLHPSTIDQAVFPSAGRAVVTKTHRT